MNRYLERVTIDRFGALRNYAAGPFERGLNVVYGPNEAGKSTIASFVRGVLFGWDSRPGASNAYRPAQGDRSGSLTFADAQGESSVTVSREGDAGGLEGDAHIVSDIDSATYDAMFSLTSDELRSLRNASDVTARLLTAGSGTGSNPADAFVEIEQRIAALTSRSEDADGSIARLVAQLEEKRDQVQRAREANALVKQQGRELAELGPSRQVASQRLADLSREVEDLAALQARIDAIDGQIRLRREQLDAVNAERVEFTTGFNGEDEVDERLVALDVSSDRAIRDKLDYYSEERAKATRAVDVAKENSAASAAAFEALLEMGEGDGRQSGPSMTRAALIAISVVLPIAFVALGAVVFLHGRQINSLSFTALGIALAVLAFFLAAGALVVLARPDRSDEGKASRLDDAQWVMLQDRKRLEASVAARDSLDAEIASYFSDNGLEAANGTIKHARALLDDAREARSRRAAASQRIASFDMRISTEKNGLAALEAERRSLLRSESISPDATAQDIGRLVAGASVRRDEQLAACEELNRRYGELALLLEQAKQDTSLDRLKYEYHQLESQLRERKRELVVLLLAKRMLEQGISAWESSSRPEVYERASQLFSLITDGAWAGVRVASDGRLVAVSPDGERRAVDQLSLGTCQQLYLSMRIAMLVHAETVGRSIPVIADDVFVHFDADRRRAAARVFAELAQTRQVIVFTCHKETVDALRQAVNNLNYIEL